MGKERPPSKEGDESRSELERRVQHELEVHREELVVQNEELRRAQQSLEESRDRYVDLFDFAPVAYITSDRAGTILDVNLTGARMLAVSRKELIGRPLLPFVMAEDRRKLLHHLQMCADLEETSTSELRIEARDGRVLPVQLVTRRMRDDSYRTILQDLTERIRGESERARIEADRKETERQATVARASSDAKDRFLAMLSHELRTPLQPILASVSALELYADVPDDIRPLLTIIRRNLDVETRLIDDLLDVTRIEHGKLKLHVEPVDVHELVRETLDRFAAGPKRNPITLELKARDHVVRADRVRLLQVLWNLVSNALRYTPAEGNVTLRTVDAIDGWLRISIQDTGIGIDPAHLGRIFAPFEQGARPHSVGLGLGLAICKGIVDALGGRIRASSSGPGGGATFEIELPVVEVGASRNTALMRRAVAPNAERHLKILLVEDHADSAMALSTLLFWAGHDVRVASTVSEALLLAKMPMDLLISDLDLPDGTGFDLVKQIVSPMPYAAIALSGHGAREDSRKSRDAGFAEHLVKPVDISVLLATVSRVMQDANARIAGASA